MTTDDRLVSGASSLNPNKSSGDIVERTWTPEQFWEFTEGRDGEFSAQQLRDVMEDVGLVIVPAAEIERLRREVESWTAKAEAAWRREDKQGADIIELSHRALTAESAVAAAWEEAARVAKDRWREWRSSYEDDLDGMDACEDISKAISARASAIRAAVSKAESGHSPSTHNSESE